ncbi:MAG: hypothetical protein WC533_01650 [Candidatus Pacearchaeota archaeon]
MALTKEEIETSIRGKDDFIKIDYLNRTLERADSFEAKKYIFLTLAGIFESKNMLKEAVRKISAAADISTTFKEKMNLYMKEAELYIRIGDFNLSEVSFRKAHSFGNNLERADLKVQYVNLFRIWAKKFELENKSRTALKIYEKLISLPQGEEQKMEVKAKLIEIYERLGMIREASSLKNRQAI